MPRTFSLQSVAIARSRQHYVVYGSDATDYNIRGTRHGLIIRQAFPTWRRAYDTVRDNVLDGLIREGSSFAGHDIGTGPSCFTAGCEQRFIGPGFSRIGFASQFSLRFLRTHNALGAAAYGQTQQPTPTPALPLVQPLRFSSSAFGFNAPPASDLPAGIESFGVEFESVVPRVSVSRADAFVGNLTRGAVERDGSIDCRGDSVAREYTFWSTSIAEVVDWLRQLYGAGVRTNSSCGFHVHIKPKLELLWRYASRAYFQGFEERYRTWAAELPTKFLARATCSWASFARWSRSFVRDVIENEAGRYHAINLQSLTKHSYRTVEHRILPNQSSLREAENSLRWILGTASSLTSGTAQVGPREADMLAGLGALFDYEGSYSSRLQQIVGATGGQLTMEQVLHPSPEAITAEG